MEVDLLIHFCLSLAIVLFLLIISFCLLHIFVGDNCYLLAHLDILDTCTKILDILGTCTKILDILGTCMKILDILGTCTKILDILGTCTKILYILALDILDLDIVGLTSCGDLRLIESRSWKFLQFARCFYDKLGKVLLIYGLMICKKFLEAEIFIGRNFREVVFDRENRKISFYGVANQQILTARPFICLKWLQQHHLRVHAVIQSCNDLQLQVSSRHWMCVGKASQ